MPGIVIVGVQWGDEGKGKATDLLGDRTDWVVMIDRDPIGVSLSYDDDEALTLELAGEDRALSLSQIARCRSWNAGSSLISAMSRGRASGMRQSPMMRAAGPADMMTTRSLRCSTTPRSWLMKR